MSIVCAPVSFITWKGHRDFDLSPAGLREVPSEALASISPGSYVLAGRVRSAGNRRQVRRPEFPFPNC